MLHAWKIGFMHPGRKKKMSLEARLKKDMQDFINKISIRHMNKKDIIELFQNFSVEQPCKRGYAQKCIKLIQSREDDRMFYRDFFQDGHFVS